MSKDLVKELKSNQTSGLTSDDAPEIHHIRGPRIENECPLSTAIVHGDGKAQVDIRKLSITKYSRVIINAHGSQSDSKHQMSIYSSLGYKSGSDYTKYNFLALQKATKKRTNKCRII